MPLPCGPGEEPFKTRNLGRNKSFRWFSGLGFSKSVLSCFLLFCWFFLASSCFSKRGFAATRSLEKIV